MLLFFCSTTRFSFPILLSFTILYVALLFIMYVKVSIGGSWFRPVTFLASTPIMHIGLFNDFTLRWRYEVERGRCEYLNAPQRRKYTRLPEWACCVVLVYRSRRIAAITIASWKRRDAAPTLRRAPLRLSRSFFLRSFSRLDSRFRFIYYGFA